MACRDELAGDEAGVARCPVDDRPPPLDVDRRVDDRSRGPAHSVAAPATGPRTARGLRRSRGCPAARSRRRPPPRAAAAPARVERDVHRIFACSSAWIISFCMIGRPDGSFSWMAWGSDSVAVRLAYLHALDRRHGVVEELGTSRQCGARLAASPIVSSISGTFALRAKNRALRRSPCSVPSTASSTEAPAAPEFRSRSTAATYPALPVRPDRPAAVDGELDRPGRAHPEAPRRRCPSPLSSCGALEADQPVRATSRISGSACSTRSRVSTAIDTAGRFSDSVSRRSVCR